MKGKSDILMFTDTQNTCLIKICQYFGCYLQKQNRIARIYKEYVK